MRGKRAKIGERRQEIGVRWKKEGDRSKEVGNKGWKMEWWKERMKARLRIEGRKQLRRKQSAVSRRPELTATC
jgi:hypothetical protein